MQIKVDTRGRKTNIEPWALFAILFLWQLPHSLSIACIYRDEYAQAGFRLLPVIHPDGKSTNRQIVINCFGLLVVALLPTLIGIAGIVYFFTALTLSLIFLGFGIDKKFRLRADVTECRLNRFAHNFLKSACHV